MSHGNTYNDLAQFGKTLLSNPSLDEGLGTISEYLKKLTGAMRCSIFVHDPLKHEFWTLLANGVHEIRVPEEQGLVGYIFTTQQDLIENQVEQNPHFLKAVDKKNAYQTVNMLGCPIYDSKNRIIGVVQLLNKLDGFTDNDLQFIKVIVHFIGSFIEVSLIHHSRDR